MRRVILVALALFALSCDGEEADNRRAAGHLVAEERHAACDGEHECASGKCVDYSGIDATQNVPICVEGDPCESVKCEKGVCAIDTIDPPKVACVLDPGRFP